MAPKFMAQPWVLGCMWMPTAVPQDGLWLAFERLRRRQEHQLWEWMWISRNQHGSGWINILFDSLWFFKSIDQAPWCEESANHNHLTMICKEQQYSRHQKPFHFAKTQRFWWKHSCYIFDHGNKAMEWVWICVDQWINYNWASNITSRFWGAHHLGAQNHGWRVMALADHSLDIHFSWSRRRGMVSRRPFRRSHPSNTGCASATYFDHHHWITIIIVSAVSFNHYPSSLELLGWRAVRGMVSRSCF